MNGMKQSSPEEGKNFLELSSALRGDRWDFLGISMKPHLNSTEINYSFHGSVIYLKYFFLRYYPKVIFPLLFDS